MRPNPELARTYPHSLKRQLIGRTAKSQRCFGSRATFSETLSGYEIYDDDNRKRFEDKYRRHRYGPEEEFPVLPKPSMETSRSALFQGRPIHICGFCKFAREPEIMVSGNQRTCSEDDRNSHGTDQFYFYSTMNQHRHALNQPDLSRRRFLIVGSNKVRILSKDPSVDQMAL